MDATLKTQAPVAATTPSGDSVGKQAIHEKLIDHKEYIDQHGDDMPAISGWKWGLKTPSGRGGTSTEGDDV
jgi:phosphoketolase